MKRQVLYCTRSLKKKILKNSGATETIFSAARLAQWPCHYPRTPEGSLVFPAARYI